MKKMLLFYAVTTVYLALPSYGQSNVTNTARTPQSIVACDLNLTNNLPSVNASCSVEFADLVVPVITDSCGNTVTPSTDNSIFPITATGTTTITWEYLNELGGIETQFQNININDFIIPVADVAVLPNIFSQCALQQADVPVPSATDNCSGVVTVTSDAVFPITVSTLITWTYTDASGNSSFQTQDIYINDFTEPVADVATLSNVHAPCKIELTDITIPTATDNCLGIVTVTSDAVFPIVATTLVTWKYTDANGNSSYQTQDFYIDDFTEPVADLAVLPNVNALCQVEAVDLIVPTATDNCSGVITVTNNATFPIVTSTLITWTFTDANGNSSFQTQDIFIDDFTDPIPDAASLPDVVSQCTLFATDLVFPTATDNCTAVVSVTNDGVFPITGSTTITWSFTDNNGNSSIQTQNINIVNDTTAPTPDAAILADVNVQCALLQTDLILPTATDNCVGVVTVTNDGVFPITASTTVTWTYTDTSGNSIAQTQNIIVNDTTAPTPDAITLANITAQCEVLEIDVTVPTATDNCSGIVTVTSDAVFPITASTTITWTYTDIDGNDILQTQNVIVADTIAPIPDAATLANISAQCAVLEADITTPTAIDNCSGFVTVTNNGIFPIATSTTITWTYSDADGNSTAQNQNVIINDTTPPTPDVAVLTNVTAQCEVLEADITAPTATDNCSGVVTVTNDGIFPITASTFFTWTFTDANGNSNSQTQNIIINDTTAPTPDLAVLADILASCEVLQTDISLPTATDNCLGLVTVTNDAIFPITVSSTIIWTFTDANGNNNTQSQNVIINDATAPTPDVAALTDFTAQCEVLLVDLTVPTATDNCSGIITVTNDGTFPITASTTISWTYTDANGNTNSQTQNIIINDTTAPTPDVFSLADLTSQCTLLEVNLVVPSATDNCSGPVTVTNDGIFPITASTTINWTYTDANGNSTIQAQNISIVNDTTAPTPDTAILADITVQCEVLEADVIVPTATDNCLGIVTVTNDGVFPITASTTITWTYSDADGNNTTQTQNVIVNDTIAPTPDTVVLVDVTAQCEVLEADIIAPTATDNCSGLVFVTNDGIFPITASTIITWTYADVNGNSNTQVQNVIINDLTAPIPDTILLSDIAAPCVVLESDLTLPTATDNCSGLITVANDGVFPITASTTISWTYTDANGNSTIQSQNIIITDTTAPIPDAAILADITAQCQVLETDLNAPTATDNCSVVTVTNDAVFPITTQGTTTFTWTYTDANGNSSSQTQNILIGDNTAPTVTLTDLTVSVNVSGIVTINATQLENGTANDNCGIASITVTPNMFACNALGDNLVNVTVTDIHGNITLATATVTVTDPTDFCGALAVDTNERGTYAIYPNPTTNLIYIEAGNDKEVQSIKLYALTGQLILAQSFHQASERYSISLASLAQGTYLLKLETAQGTFTKRVMKQ